MDECIELVSSVLASLEKGEADMPLRFGYKLPLPEGKFGVLASMPSYLSLPSGESFCANKVITVYPANKAAGMHSHQGAILLFEAAHGKLVAVVDAGEVTAVRTAAASGVATRLLAREGEDVAELALLGSGAQGTQGQPPTAAQGLGGGAAPPSMHTSQASGDVSELPDHLLGLVLAQVALPSYHP